MEGIFTKAELNTVRPPDPVLPLCGKCNLFRGCRSPKMPVSGNGRRGILLVGEAPGATEDRDGVQFVGEAGRLLQKTLRRVGVDMREDCWLTNALSCRPPDNRIPNEKMVEYCRPLVMRAIEELRPDVIVPLGARAIKSVVGYLWRDDVGEVRRWTGFRIPSARWSAWVCPTYHPSHILRNWDRDRNRSDNPVEDMVFERDLKAVAGLDGPPPTPPDYDKIVEVIQDPARAADRIAQTMNAGEVAFDYETTCLRPDGPDAEIVCCSVGTPTDAFAFPWTGETRLAASRLLKCREVKKVGWNCFSGDTKILTREKGVVPIGEVSGQEVFVLNHERRWVVAKIKSFGKQRTKKVTFVRRNFRVTVRATEGHRWIDARSGGTKTTGELRRHRYGAGLGGTADQVPYLCAPKMVDDPTDYIKGIKHGIVFGDGWKRKDRDGYYQIRLCGHKKVLVKYFQGHDTSEVPSHNGDVTVYIPCEPRLLKELPVAGESDSYLIGFVRGLLATDGCVTKDGYVSVTNHRKAIEWLEKYAPVVGFLFQGKTDTKKYANLYEGNFGAKADTWTLYFSRDSVDKNDFLLPCHKGNFRKLNMGPFKFSERDEGRLEEVFCAVVPDGHSFTLDKGLVTGNCKMEDRWTRAKLGFPVAGWAWDGMIAAHALDARGSAGDGAGDRRKGRGITGLKFQTFVRLGVEDYSSSVAEYMKADGTNAPNRLRELMRRDPRRLLRYNALDSLFTAIVCEQQRKEVY